MFRRINGRLLVYDEEPPVSLPEAIEKEKPMAKKMMPKPKKGGKKGGKKKGC